MLKTPNLSPIEGVCKFGQGRGARLWCRFGQKTFRSCRWQRLVARNCDMFENEGVPETMF